MKVTGARARPRRRLRSLFGLVWRNLNEYRARALLSGLALSFGAAMIIAADLVGASLLAALLNAGVEGAEVTHGFIAEQFDLMISIVGYVLVAAAGFLVFNAFTMTVTQRQRQIGLLRALGLARRQVLWVTVLEGLLLGSLGVGAGLLAGPLLGYGVIALLSAVAGDYFAFGQDPAVGTSTVLQAALMGLGMTFIAVWWPARRATRVSPLRALRLEIGPDSSLGRRRRVGATGFGLALVIIVAAVVIGTTPGAWADAPLNLQLTVGLLLVWLVGWLLLLPALIRATSRSARWCLRPWGATGRLISDNLRRDTGRVSLTIISLALGLIMIVGMTGFMTFAFDELFGASLARITEKQTWMIFPFDISGGVYDIAVAETMLIAPADLTAIQEAVGAQATVAATYFVLAPEISFLGDSYFSYVYDPEVLRREQTLFEFSEGNWEAAWPYLQSSCGLLLAPVVAERNGVGLYDALTLATPHGPLTCHVAGIGRTFMNASIINIGVADQFDLTAPVGVAVFPNAGVDAAAFDNEMARLGQMLPHLWLTSLTNYMTMVDTIVDLFGVSLNVLLLLIVVAAAFGVINTVMMSVSERRAELGLLRAVGATRRQVTWVVAGEAALMGLIGGFLGLVVGLGAVIIIVIVYGGRSWGITDLDLWAAVGRTIPVAGLNGAVGLVVTPLIAGLAAWLPVRRVLRGRMVTLLTP